ncbi:MAG: hypothetical protein VKK97_04175 [Synechococcaceae cyanobacterium]|nr:hypothetical protein [Synechococcaceae cyanobacterium]
MRLRFHRSPLIPLAPLHRSPASPPSLDAIAVADHPAEAYGIAGLIRFTLLSLYAALVLPLPFLAPSAWRPFALLGLLLGALPILALLSERVELRPSGLRVGYPAWSAWLLRRGWALPWEAIADLKPVATSQGGRVFYVRVKPDPTAVAAEPIKAYLLPQRLERFETFLASFSRYTGLNTASVGRLTPAWTYWLLASFSLLLLLGDLLFGLQQLV